MLLVITMCLYLGLNLQSIEPFAGTLPLSYRAGHGNRIHFLSYMLHIGYAQYNINIYSQVSCNFKMTELGSIHILRNQLRGEGEVSQMLMFVDMGGGGSRNPQKLIT